MKKFICIKAGTDYKGLMVKKGQEVRVDGKGAEAFKDHPHWKEVPSEEGAKKKPVKKAAPEKKPAKKVKEVPNSGNFDM